MANPNEADDFDITKVTAQPKDKGQYVTPIVSKPPERDENDITQIKSEDPDYRNMGWGTVARNFFGRALPHAGEIYSGLWDVATHPIETAKTIGSAAMGIPTKVMESIQPAQYNPLGLSDEEMERSSQNAPKFNPFGMSQEDLQHSQDVLNAMLSHPVETYGPLFRGDTSGVRKSLSTRPWDIPMDVSAAIPVVGVPLRAAGLAERAGLIGKALNVTADIAKTANPVSAPLAAAGLVGRNILPAITKAQAGLTSIPENMVEAARMAGNSPNPVVRSTFNRFLSGEGKVAEIAQDLENATRESHQNQKSSYLRDRRNLALNTNELDLTHGGAESPLALAQALENYAFPKGDVSPILSRDVEPVRLAINKIYDAYSSPNSTLRNMDNLDLTKRTLQGLYNNISDTHASGMVNDIAKSVKNLISNNDPVYARMLENWQNHLKDIENLKLALGAGGGTPEVLRVSKLMRAASKGDPLSQYKMSLLDDIVQNTQSGKMIPYKLAGALMNPTMSNKTQVMKDALINAGISGIMYGAGVPIPAVAGTFGIGMAGSSPRLTGKSQYLLGRAQGAIPEALKSFAPSAANVVGGPVTRDIMSQMGQPQVGGIPEQSTGGRIERREGGRVGVDHHAEAASLVRAAEAAKKRESRTTEPLLNSPDEHIVKALSLANEAI